MKCGCCTIPMSRQNSRKGGHEREPRLSGAGLGGKRRENPPAEEFWGSEISEYPIDPDTEERIKQMYLKKIEWWNSPDYPYEKPKGINVAYLRVVPLSGEIDEYGFCKAIYRVYYGKCLYDECTNDSHLRDRNPDKRKNRVCEFCQMPDDHGSCCLSCHKKSRFGFDKILDKLRPKCPYS